MNNNNNTWKEQQRQQRQLQQQHLETKQLMHTTNSAGRSRRNRTKNYEHDYEVLLAGRHTSYLPTIINSREETEERASCFFSDGGTICIPSLEATWATLPLAARLRIPPHVAALTFSSYVRKTTDDDDDPRCPPRHAAATGEEPEPDRCHATTGKKTKTTTTVVDAGGEKEGGNSTAGRRTTTPPTPRTTIERDATEEPASEPHNETTSSSVRPYSLGRTPNRQAETAAEAEKTKPTQRSHNPPSSDTDEEPKEDEGEDDNLDDWLDSMI